VIKATDKNGRAEKMRSWMKKKRAPFSAAMLCEGIGARGGLERKRTKASLQEFRRRGEVIRLAQGEYAYRRGYEHKQRRTSAPIRRRVCKAMYVCGLAGCFTGADIQRMTGVTSIYFYKIASELHRDGYISRVKNTGRRAVYRIAYRERFRREVLK